MIDNTFTLISRIDGEIRRFITEELAAEGIADIVPMNELARRIDRTPQTVTCLIKKLVNTGYVTTGKSSGDSRVTMAALTEQGRHLASVLQRISEKIYERQYFGIPEDDIPILRGALMKMHSNFAEKEL